MAPKIKKGDVLDEEQNQPLQAVVMADSFEPRFRPFTREKPRCLLPLCNTPLIEYTFQFLAASGVDEVFVYCGPDHANLVEEYVQQSKWSSAISPFSNVQVLHSTSTTIGDAMRDLDKRNILTTDFILLYGDVVSNVAMQDVIAAHRARREKNKEAIMTMVLRKVSQKYHAQATMNLPFFVLQPDTNRCLHYEEKGKTKKQHRFTLDSEILSHSELSLHVDLLDCGIDICTPDVLALWSDNFDYQTPRSGFLYGVLKDYELNGKTIHSYVLDDTYASRVCNFQAYNLVTKDLLSRRVFPIAPDLNLLESQSYRLVRDDVYAEQAVSWPRSCTVGEGTVIGAKTSIGENSHIIGSIVGSGCKIGQNVKLSNVHLWDNAVVGDNTVVNAAIIASDVVIGKDCTIEAGALISFGVRVSDGTVVHGTSRLTRHSSGQEVKAVSRELVGADGDGFEYSSCDSEDEAFSAYNRPGADFYKHISTSSHSVSTIGSVDETVEDDFSTYDRNNRASMISIASDDAGFGSTHRDFHQDAVTSIVDSLQQGHESSTIQLELRGLRMATNASESMVRRSVVVAFAKRILQLVAEGAQPKQSVHNVFDEHKHLLSRMVFDKTQKEKSDQVDLMTQFEKYLSRQDDGDSLLLYICNEFYLLEIVEEAGFEQWWNRESLSPEVVKVRVKSKQFIDLVLDGDSDSDDSGDDDDDDDDDSDDEDEDDD